ncbi:hypothetical protein NN561_015508 [Cricetulus griseus]
MRQSPSRIYGHGRLSCVQESVSLGDVGTDRWRSQGTQSAQGAVREQLHLPPLVPGGVPRIVATLSRLRCSGLLHTWGSGGLRDSGVPTTGPCPRCLNGCCPAAIAGTGDSSTPLPPRLRSTPHLNPWPCSYQSAGGQHRHRCQHCLELPASQPASLC